MPLTLLLAAALTAASPAPMPTGDALTRQIADKDARLFWAAFEGCDAKALPDLLAPDFRMIHDKGGLVEPSRDAMIADFAKSCAARQPEVRAQIFQCDSVITEPRRNQRQ